MTVHAIAGWFLASALLLSFAVFLAVSSNAFLATQHWTGWGLALAFCLMALQGFRGIRQMWSASAFLLLHLNLGWIAILLFFVHAGGFGGAPDGVFQRILWISFSVVLLSGALGYAFQRICTRRQRHWDALPFQRVAEERAELAAEADEAFQRVVRRGAPALLTRFYAHRLLPFLRAPRNFLRHSVGSARPLEELLLEMDFAGGELVEDTDFARMRAIVRRKSHLDQRFALYWLQRGWLFVHVPAAAASAFLLFFHVILVHAYGG